jgi:HlyD family secretion protein
VARAEAQLAQKRATAARRRELATRGAGSAEAAELAETEAALAQADIGVNRADAAVARAALAEARANHQAERTALAKHALLAPFDALVVARTREPGTALSAAVLVVTHDEKIFDRFDRLVSLRDGRIEVGALSPPGQPSR